MEEKKKGQYTGLDEAIAKEYIPLIMSYEPSNDKELKADNRSEEEMLHSAVFIAKHLLMRNKSLEDEVEKLVSEVRHNTEKYKQVRKFLAQAMTLISDIYSYN